MYTYIRTYVQSIGKNDLSIVYNLEYETICRGYFYYLLSTYARDTYNSYKISTPLTARSPFGFNSFTYVYIFMKRN